MRWGLFQMAEYINLITLSGLTVTLFFAGWHGPWGPRAALVRAQARCVLFDLHLAADDAAAAALRPADALRLEGAAARRDDQRRRHRRCWWSGSTDEPHPHDTLKGFGVTLKQIFKKPITQQYPEYKRPVYPRFRGRHRLWRHENGLEKCVGCSLCAAACPADCIRVVAGREHARQPRLGRRALRAHLRDQPEPLHLLRLLRARVPVRRDHARQRVRDLGVQPRRPDLHEGHAARGADQEGAGRRPRALRHADPLLQGSYRSAVGNFLVWVVWVVAASPASAPGIAVVTFHNPFYSALALIGNLGSLAVLYLLLSAEFVAAAQVLVYAGAVMVMFLFVIAYIGRARTRRGPAGRAGRRSAASLAGGAILVEIIVVIGLKAGGASRRGRHHGRLRRPAQIGRSS